MSTAWRASSRRQWLQPSEFVRAIRSVADGDTDLPIELSPHLVRHIDVHLRNAQQSSKPSTTPTRAALENGDPIAQAVMKPGAIHLKPSPDGAKDGVRAGPDQFSDGFVWMAAFGSLKVAEDVLP
jgi:hypothetical protein